jgi:hypothetical protein
MQINFEVSGLDEIVQKCSSFNSNAPTLIQQRILESVQENVLPVAKALAPKKTGALVASIDAMPGPQAPNVLLVAEKFYAPFLEFGTRYIPEGKFTFLRPALQEGVQKIVSDIEELMISIFTE